MTFVSKQVSGHISISINKALLCAFILHEFTIEESFLNVNDKDLQRCHVGMFVKCRSVSVHRDLPRLRRSGATSYVSRLIHRRGRVSGATICLYKC